MGEEWLSSSESPSPPQPIAVTGARPLLAGPLERGRARLWTQAMQMRAATERVTAADPRLGEQFSEILAVQQDITSATNPLTFSEYMAATLVNLRLHNLTGVHFKDAPLALAMR